VIGGDKPAENQPIRQITLITQSSLTLINSEARRHYPGALPRAATPQNNSNRQHQEHKLCGPSLQPFLRPAAVTGMTAWVR
jgi:hypothetical protein